MINRKILFSGLRKAFGPFNQMQVDVVQAVVAEFERRKLTDVRWLAYMLATGWGEAKWEPVREIGRGKGKEYGKLVRGVSYYGRGLVQLTWLVNYEKMSKTLNLPLVEDPDLVMQVPVAVAIMFEGMTTGLSAKDSFTKYQLHDFFNNTVDDPVGARRIINGKNKAQKFAGWHNQILEVLTAAVVKPAVMKPSQVEAAPLPLPTPVAEDRIHSAVGSLLVAIAAAIGLGILTVVAFFMEK
jgi:putative chitinase